MVKVKWAVIGCLVALGGMILSGGCIRPKPLERPAWVTKGAAAFPGDEGNYFFGVGIKAKSMNIAMQREAADHRARVEIARIINVYVALFLKDFMQESPDYFKPEYSGSKEFIQSVSKEVSEATLIACEIVDHWTDPKDEALYSLARMPKNGADDALVKRIRERRAILMEMKTDEALRELDEELKKKDIREEKMLFGE